MIAIKLKSKANWSSWQQQRSTLLTTVNSLGHTTSNWWLFFFFLFVVWCWHWSEQDHLFLMQLNPHIIIMLNLYSIYFWSDNSLVWSEIHLIRIVDNLISLNDLCETSIKCIIQHQCKFKSWFVCHTWSNLDACQWWSDSIPWPRYLLTTIWSQHDIHL